jgi:hypothetical protein
VNAPLSIRPRWFADIAQGLSWRSGEIVLMAWIYYDESGEYDAKGNLINLTVGGCVSSLEKWRAFANDWNVILDREGLEFFHMADFEAWRSPFDFKLENGERDKAKHNRVLNDLLDTMLQYIEGLYGFVGNSILKQSDNAHKTMLEDSIGGAIKNAVLDTWTFYEKPLNLVFDQQTHFPLTEIKKYVDFYDFGGAKGRVKNVIFGRSEECPALQAADIIAYEMSKTQRLNRPQRYPFTKLIEGGKVRNIAMRLGFGPVRFAKIDLN